MVASVTFGQRHKAAVRITAPTMTVFSGKQVVPVDYEAEVSQRLLDAILDGDIKTASVCVSDPLLDVNFVGAVSLKTRRSEVVLRDETASEIRVEYEEFKTDVTALFLAVSFGNVALVKMLLVSFFFSSEFETVE